MRIWQTIDAALIARLNKAVQQVHADLYPELFKPYSFADMQAAFEEYLRDESSFFFVVAKDETSRPVGYVWVQLRSVAPNVFRRGYKTAHVHQLSVVEPEHRRGFGSALMEYVTTFASETGCVQVELDYWVENTPAAAFYERIGYKPKRIIVQKPL